MIRNFLRSMATAAIAMTIPAVANPTVANAAPIFLNSVASGQFTDSDLPGAPDFGPFPLNLVASGSGRETRASYEFNLSAALPSQPLSSAILSVTLEPQLDNCVFLDPCPPLTALSVFGYAGNGTIEAADYLAGIFAAATGTIPGPGGVIDLDVTAFVTDLLAANAPFAGFTYRAGSEGGLNLPSTTTLALTFAQEVPEPGSLALLGTGLIGLGLLRRGLRSLGRSR